MVPLLYWIQFYQDHGDNSQEHVFCCMMSEVINKFFLVVIEFSSFQIVVAGLNQSMAIASLSITYMSLCMMLLEMCTTYI